MRVRRQFARFVVVGGVGFVVDAGVLLAAVRLAGADPLAGRAVSFLAAATATWLLNRAFTFAAPVGEPGRQPAASRSLAREWLAYVSLMLGGFAVNYGTYWLSLRLAPPPPSNLLLTGAVAAGSVAGLVVNFATSRWLLYARGNRPSHA